MERADYAILGAGIAGVSAAEMVRKFDPRGSILLLSGERELPYDRPPLSKELLRGERSADDVHLHPANRYTELQISLELARPALSINPEHATVTCADGEQVRYRRLLIATGARPRRLGVPGESLDGVFPLRTLSEAQRIREATLDPQHVAIIGAGFIGLEAAASLALDGHSVQVLNLDRTIWPGLLRPETAQRIQRNLEDLGVQFHHGQRVIGFEGTHRVESVHTSSHTFMATVAIVGAGIERNTEIAAAAGLRVEDGILVDQFLQTSAPGIFAAGDAARLRSDRESPHLEHWDNAVVQGRIAGANMAGQRVPFRHVPFFWSDLPGLTLNVIGHLPTTADVITRGNPESLEFSQLYLANQQLQGALLINRSKDRRAITTLIEQRVDLTDRLGDLADPTRPLASLIPRP